MPPHRLDPAPPVVGEEVRARLDEHRLPADLRLRVLAVSPDHLGRRRRAQRQQSCGQEHSSHGNPDSGVRCWAGSASDSSASYSASRLCTSSRAGAASAGATSTTIDSRPAITAQEAWRAHGLAPAVETVTADHPARRTAEIGVTGRRDLPRRRERDRDAAEPPGVDAWLDQPTPRTASSRFRSCVRLRHQVAVPAGSPGSGGGPGARPTPTVRVVAPFAPPAGRRTGSVQPPPKAPSHTGPSPRATASSSLAAISRPPGRGFGRGGVPHVCGSTSARVVASCLADAPSTATPSRLVGPTRCPVGWTPRARPPRPGPILATLGQRDSFLISSAKRSGR